MSTESLSLPIPAAGAGRAPSGPGIVRPFWLLWLLLAALTQGVMPLVHGHTFGRERVAEEMVRTYEREFGGSLGDQREEIYQRQVRAQGAGSAVVAGALTVVVAILIAVVMHVMSVLFLTELTPLRTLNAATMSLALASLFRAALWGLQVFAKGVSGAFEIGWVATAGTSFPGLLGIADGALARSLAFFDLGTAVAILVAAFFLWDDESKVSLPAAVGIVAFPPLLLWALSLGFALVF
jgi:hypothetical protein